MTEAIDAFGTLLAIGDDASPTKYTTIAEVLDIGGPKLEREQHDVTSHSSSAGWREFLAGLKDGGEVAFKINYNPVATTHKNSAGGLLYELAQGDAVRNFQITFPDDAETKWIVPGNVKAYGPDMPVDGPLTAEIVIKVSGQPTLL